MANSLLRRLHLSREGIERISAFADRLHTVPEFLEEAIRSFESSKTLIDPIRQALPWMDIAGAAIGAVGSVAPPIGFLAGLFERLKKPPTLEDQAFIACTLAYQQALVQAIEESRDPPGPGSTNLRKEFSPARDLEGASLDFSTFDSSRPTDHPFFRESHTYLRQFARVVGYDENHTERLLEIVSETFSDALARLLAEDRFNVLRRYLESNRGVKAAYNALHAHGDLQRGLFESEPVFDREPFATRDIYVDPYCRSVLWSDLRKRDRPAAGKSHQNDQLLSEAILQEILKPELNDFIVVQGPPGSGKSALGLSLACLLLERGLHPIRIALRDLPTLTDDARAHEIESALQQAIKLPKGWNGRQKNLFIEDEIFRQSRPIPGHDAEMCPYVLILDGWDELRVQSSGSTGSLLRRLLTCLQEKFFEGNQGLAPVRIVLMGRKSWELEKNVFYAYFRDDTLIHEILPLRPEQFQVLMERISQSLRNPKTKYWRGSARRLRALVSAYTEAVDPTLYPFESPEHGLELLSYPLWALLAARLVAGSRASVKKIVNDNSTMIFRRILDQTCSKAGRHETDKIDIRRRSVLGPSELRGFLRSMAAAIEVQGGDSVAYDELGPRLDPMDHIRGYKLQSTSAYTDKLNRLTLSFHVTAYPNGYKFSHPSLQRYLFAEHLIEVLKEEARAIEADTPTPARPYSWKDFQKSDPYYILSRRLSYLLAPQWLRGESWSHVANLLAWEISRSTSRPVSSDATEPMELGGWIRARDALATLWGWWYEGGHLRPRSTDANGQREGLRFREPFISYLIDWAVPLQSEGHQDRMPLSVALDAQLGDGLFRLAALLHWLAATRQGLLGARRADQQLSPLSPDPNSYQSRYRVGRRELRRFRPAASCPEAFHEIVARINAARGRPAGPFPLGVNLHGVDLRGVSFSIVKPASAGEEPVLCQEADLTEARLDGAYLERFEASRLVAPGLRATSAMMHDAEFGDALLDGANLRFARLFRANFTGARLERAKLRMAAAQKARFERAKMQGADLERADLRGAKLNGADLSGADLSDADLSEAELRGADLRGTKLERTHLEKADLQGAKLQGVDLSSTTGLRSAKLEKAELQGANLPPDLPIPRKPQRNRFIRR